MNTMISSGVTHTYYASGTDQTQYHTPYSEFISGYNTISAYSIITVQWGSGNRVGQICISEYGHNPGIWYRIKHDANWVPWKEIMTDTSDIISNIEANEIPLGGIITGKMTAPPSDNFIYHPGTDRISKNTYPEFVKSLVGSNGATCYYDGVTTKYDNIFNAASYSIDTPPVFFSSVYNVAITAFPVDGSGGSNLSIFKYNPATKQLINTGIVVSNPSYAPNKYIGITVDGKYLIVLSNTLAYIKVYDINTMALIFNVVLSGTTPTGIDTLYSMYYLVGSRLHMVGINNYYTVDNGASISNTIRTIGNHTYTGCAITPYGVYTASTGIITKTILGSNSYEIIRIPDYIGGSSSSNVKILGMGEDINTILVQVETPTEFGIIHNPFSIYRFNTANNTFTKICEYESDLNPHASFSIGDLKYNDLTSDIRIMISNSAIDITSKYTRGITNPSSIPNHGGFIYNNRYLITFSKESNTTSLLASTYDLLDPSYVTMNASNATYIRVK